MDLVSLACEMICWLWYIPVSIYRILGECHLLSSFQGKALRMLVDIARLAERFNTRSPSRTWYSIYQFTRCFTRRPSDYDVIFDFCIDSAS